MENPNPHFCGYLELTEVMGFPVRAVGYRIPFLKGDSIKLRFHARRVGGETLNTDGLTIKMKIGASEIDGAAYSHVEGKWDFEVSSEITDALTAGNQDVSFILTRTVGGKSTFIRIHEAISVVSHA